MAKVLVLYYSAYGHIEAMANAVATGAREAGASVDVRRVPELVPESVADAAHYKREQPAPLAKPEDLADYDAIVLGTGTRFGRMGSQMATTWTRRTGFGPAACCKAKSGRPSPPRQASMVARRRRCFR